MKARADLDERAKPAVHHEGSGSRNGDPGEDLEESTLPRAIGSHQPEHLAALEREGDISKRPELFSRLNFTAQQARGEPAHFVLDRKDVPAASQPVALCNIVELDGRV